MGHSFLMPGVMYLMLFVPSDRICLIKKIKSNKQTQHELDMQQCRHRKINMLESLLAVLITLCIFYTFYIQTSTNRKWRDKQFGLSDCCCDLLRLCGLHLQHAVAILVAIVTEQVIRRRLTSLDDEDALWGQGRENGERIHVDWNPGDIGEEEGN